MKKKKLPSDFDLLVASHDMNSFAEFFTKYEITATNVGKSTSNAFSYKDLSVEQAQFLMDNGLDPNIDCGFGYSAVAQQAKYRRARLEEKEITDLESFIKEIDQMNK